MSTIVINPADMTGVPDFNILNDNVIKSVGYNIENTEYSLSYTNVKYVQQYSGVEGPNPLLFDWYTFKNNILTSESKNPDIIVFAKDIPILYHYNNQQSYIHRSSLIKYDIDKPDGINNIDINSIEYDMYEISSNQSEDDPFGYIKYPKNCKFVDESWSENDVLKFFLTYDSNNNPIHFNSDLNNTAGDITCIIKIQEKTLSIYVTTSGITNPLIDSPNTSINYISENINIKLKLKLFSKTQETVGQDTKIVINSNELNQQNTTVSGQQISEYIADNIMVMYGAGKKTATITCYYVDYYDTEGNLVYERDSGDTISVGDTVRPMIRRNDILVPLSTLPDGSPRDFEVVSSEIFYDGKIKNTLQLVESAKTVIDEQYRNIIKQIIAREQEVSLGSFYLNDLDEFGGYSFYNNKKITRVTMPKGVITIGESAFSHCENLKNILFSNTLKTIGPEAFEYCTSLSGDIVIPNSVEVISNSAFNECSSIKSVTQSAKTIDRFAFYNCESLESFEIGANVESFEDGTFVAGCINLVKFTNSSNNTNFTVSGGMLFNSDKTKLIAFPTSSGEMPEVQEIGSYAFYNNKKLTEIFINEATTTIDSYAFAECDNLSVVGIPSSVTTIKAGAFARCDKLKIIEIFSSVPPDIYSSDVFGSVVQEIRIPTGSLSTYLDAPMWNLFENILVEVDNLV